MLPRKKTGYDDIFTVPEPWDIRVVSCCQQQLRIDLAIHYNSPLLKCPECASSFCVKQIIPITWKSVRRYGYNVYMTAYLPMIDEHIPGCKLNNDPIALRDMLLIDLVVNKITAIWDMNPVCDFLSAVGPTNFSHGKLRW